MKFSYLALTTMLFMSFSASLFAFDTAKNKLKNETGINLPTQEWKFPDGIDEIGALDISKLPDSPYAKAVIYGYQLITQTHNYIGPNAKDSKKAYAGNNLSCSSCHASAGTKQFQSSFVGIVARFPQFNARGDKVVSIEDRINGCMQRSMNGKALPLNSPEMRAMVTYMHWLSQGIPVGANIKGQGLGKVNLLPRAASPKKGKIVYEANCVACHGENGEGLQNPDYKTGDYYIYPPLWGDDSYNTGAGMYRLIKAAQYIKHSMPQGNPTLSDEEAFDVASYINSQPRPIKADREADFPDRSIKPLDMDVAPYDDNFSIEQHRFGPYKQMYK
ncbi:c-type cytochrome [Campylobacter geochelonis]|uniref:Cytochrome c family protein n=1 Tax=Campylobacter geochelonis TaxID=1780362 RepID=A0A128EK08_9BACT|nr:c-type cytochrome [Campylobacter geochelonis]QKF71687.1 cytochrome c [Campylobacter geochelonis]CZE49240.1 Cytochrome c family protein [Campylobacter geochelonis]